jgi:hypothetical protein
MCLPDQSALLVDGANGVCDAPRHLGDVTWTTTALEGLAGIVVGALVLTLAARRPGLALALALALLVGAAVPGLHTLLAERPSRATLASSVSGLHDRVREHARSTGPVEAGACLACGPIVRLATVDLSEREGPVWTLAPSDLVETLPVVRPWLLPWRAALGLALATLAGAVILALAGARAPSGAALHLVARVLAGCALTAAFLFHPGVGLLALLLIAGAALGARHARPLPVRASLLPLAALSILVAVALLRPASPVYWDELVWLAKARAAAGDLFDFTALALGADTPLVPRGYPLSAPLLTAALALLDPSTEALLGGQISLALVAMSALVLTLARLDAIDAGPRRLAVSLVVLAATPMFWVHWQSAYLDLTVGLLGATLLVALRLDDLGDGLGRPIAVASALLAAGLKDEGLAHVVAITVAQLVALRGARAGALLSLAGGALALGSVRVTLWARGGSPDDHALSGVALDFVPTLLRLAAGHAADVTSWGAAPWLALASAVVVARSEDRGARATGLSLLGLTLLLGAALVLGPDRLREFASNGTLLGRMGVQLLPLAALVVAGALGPGAARRAASRDARPQALQRALDAALAAPPQKEPREGLQSETT